MFYDTQEQLTFRVTTYSTHHLWASYYQTPLFLEAARHIFNFQIFNDISEEVLRQPYCEHSRAEVFISHCRPCSNVGLTGTPAVPDHAYRRI